jgi:biotin carboxyl carrier protein
MPGMIVSFEKQASDSVTEGETVVVLKDMEMENALAAPAAGTIKKIYFESGDSVATGDVLCIIE